MITRLLKRYATGYAVEGLAKALDEAVAARDYWRMKFIAEHERRAETNAELGRTINRLERLLSKKNRRSAAQHRALNPTNSHTGRKHP